MHLTQSEELLIQKSCDKWWRGAECKLVQPGILVMKTGPHGRKHRTFQEEEGFDFRDSGARRLVSEELRCFSPDSVAVHPPDDCCPSGVSLKSQQKARNMCKRLVNHVCSVILEHLRKKKFVLLGAPWPVWTLNLASVRKGCRKAWRDEKSNFCEQERSDGRDSAQKTRVCIRSSISGGAKRETKAGNGSCRGTKDDVAGTGHRFDACDPTTGCV